MKIPYICLGHPLVWNRPFWPSGNAKVPVRLASYGGFTFIELMIVIVVASILGALAAPAIGTLVRNQRISTQANELVADLNFARAEAVKRGARVVICAGTASSCSGTNWETSRAIFVDADGDSAISAGEAVLRARETLEGGNTLRTNPVVSTVAFASGGTSTASQFRLCDSRGASFGRAISVAATGQVRVTNPAPACS